MLRILVKKNVKREGDPQFPIHNGNLEMSLYFFKI